MVDERILSKWLDVEKAALDFRVGPDFVVPVVVLVDFAFGLLVSAAAVEKGVGFFPLERSWRCSGSSSATASTILSPKFLRNSKSAS